MHRCRSLRVPPLKRWVAMLGGSGTMGRKRTWPPQSSLSPRAIWTSASCFSPDLQTGDFPRSAANGRSGFPTGTKPLSQGRKENSFPENKFRLPTRGCPIAKRSASTISPSTAQGSSRTRRTGASVRISRSLLKFRRNRSQTRSSHEFSPREMAQTLTRLITEAR